VASEVEQAESREPFEKESRTKSPWVSLIKAYPVAIAYVLFCAGLIVLMPAPGSQTWSRMVGAAILFGIVLGHGICASIWMSLGTGSTQTRTNLGLVWLLLIATAGAVRIGQIGPATAVDVAIFTLAVGTVLMVQAIFVRSLLWITRVSFEIELASQAAAPGHAGDRSQFKIAQIMAFTAMVAIVIAIGRGLVQLLAASDVLAASPLPLYVFIAVATVLVTLPIAAASLLDRHSIFAMTVAAVFIFGVTAVELPTLTAAKLAYRNDLSSLMVVAINLSTSLVVLAYTLGLRLFGFRLTMGSRHGT
jgi:hypothetical protein